MKIKIATGDVSGPSGGLAFALTIIDDLTPGNLTGGKTVAVTGTIDGDGTVGEVGGVPQKAVAGTRRAGARVMIVPRAEVHDARTKAGDMKVIGVSHPRPGAHAPCVTTAAPRSRTRRLSRRGGPRDPEGPPIPWCAVIAPRGPRG